MDIQFSAESQKSETAGDKGEQRSETLSPHLGKLECPSLLGIFSSFFFFLSVVGVYYYYYYYKQQSECSTDRAPLSIFVEVNLRRGNNQLQKRGLKKD